MSFTYPGCRTDADGPCQLATSSEDACSSEFGGTSFYQKRYCMCTNGYFSRSSQCWNDCYHFNATTTDTLSISIDSRLVELDCESYSLAILSDELFYSSLSAASESREASITSSSTNSGVNSATATGDVGGASQGASASQVVPPSTSWAERPSSTAEAQQGAGVSTTRAAKNNALLSIVSILALSYVFGSR